MLTNVLADAPQFQFDGEKTVDGRRLYAWSFRIPLERSTSDGAARRRPSPTRGRPRPQPGEGNSRERRGPPAGRDLLLAVERQMLDYSSQRIRRGRFPASPSGAPEIRHPRRGVDAAVTFSACPVPRGISRQLPGHAHSAPEEAWIGRRLPSPRLLPVTIGLTHSIEQRRKGGGRSVHRPADEARFGAETPREALRSAPAGVS